MTTKNVTPACDWPLDMRTGQPCPKCGSEIVYNGNYFCSQYYWCPEIRRDYRTYSSDAIRDGLCDWAMPESDDNDPLYKRCIAGLMANRQKDKERARRRKK